MTETTTVATGLTERISFMIADRSDQPDGSAATLAERALVDTVGVAIAAKAEPAVSVALEVFGHPIPSGPSTVLVNGTHTSPLNAALLGGISAHALDYDDVDDSFIGHPSAVLVPALLAVGEQIDCSGEDVLDAYWVGLRACRMVEAVLGITNHYNLGWHSTSTIGSLGAAAAVSRLLRLTRPEAQQALGIAGSLAAGSRQNFGTMTKPLHAGVAAENGVKSAGLAAAGFTSDPHQLEGPAGFLALHAGRHLDVAEHDSLLTSANGIESPTLNVKLYPCCYYTHHAADAMLDLVAAGLRYEHVTSIVVTVEPGRMAPLIHHRPETGLQGKFSLEYVMAAALLDGRLNLKTFTDEQIMRPAAQDILRRVRAVEAEVPPVGEPSWDSSFATVQVHTVDGEKRKNRVDRPFGHASRPVSDERLFEKFADCLDFADVSGASAAYTMLRDFRSVRSVRQATEKLAQAVRGSG